MDYKHWLQVDHITFLIALILIGANIHLQMRELTILAFILMVIAFIYDAFLE